jgi:ribonuclease P protein component
VARNRLRRRLREHTRRRLLTLLPPIDVVIRTRDVAYDALRAALYGDLDQWYARLRP